MYTQHSYLDKLLVDECIRGRRREAEAARAGTAALRVGDRFEQLSAGSPLLQRRFVRRRRWFIRHRAINDHRSVTM